MESWRASIGRFTPPAGCRGTKVKAREAKKPEKIRELWLAKELVLSILYVVLATCVMFWIAPAAPAINSSYRE